MSSSTFEVTEPEIENDKNLDFGLDSCEENGITLSAQLDGELPKDHTYTKEPDGEKASDDNDQSVNDEGEKTEDVSSPSKKSKASRSAKASKKPVSKAKSPVKKATSPVKRRGRKPSLKESPPEADKSLNNGDIDEKESKSEDSGEEKLKAVSKRGRKRKVEEKEAVIDQSIVDEVQNIAEESADGNTEAEESPKKRRNTPPKKVSKEKSEPKKSASKLETVETKGLPKGWTKKCVVRQSGRTAGLIDIYVFSPEGMKFRSRPELAAYLQRTKSPLKLDAFDFSKKVSKGEPSPVKKVTKKATPPPKPPAQKSPVKKQKKAKAETPKKLLVKIKPKKNKLPEINPPKKIAKSEKSASPPKSGRRGTKRSSKSKA